MTDVVASIVGESPRAPGDEPSVVRPEDGSWLVDGGLEIDAVADLLKTKHLLTSGASALLHTGRSCDLSTRPCSAHRDVFEREGYGFEIVDMDGNGVDRVLIHRTPASGPSNAGSSSD
jgi:putative hemolysin